MNRLPDSVFVALFADAIGAAERRSSMNPVPNPQLSLFDLPPMPVDPDAVALVEYLDRAFVWRTRDQIRRDLGFDDRRIRAAREAAEDFIVSCHLGFRHMKHCTQDERALGHQFFEHQGKDMLVKAAKKKDVAAIWDFAFPTANVQEAAHA